MKALVLILVSLAVSSSYAQDVWYSSTFTSAGVHLDVVKGVRTPGFVLKGQGRVRLNSTDSSKDMAKIVIGQSVYDCEGLIKKKHYGDVVEFLCSMKPENYFQLLDFKAEQLDAYGKTKEVLVNYSDAHNAYPNLISLGFIGDTEKINSYFSKKVNNPLNDLEQVELSMTPTKLFPM